MQAKTGNEKQFEAALQRLRGKDFDISEEAAEIQVLPFYHYTLLSTKLKSYKLIIT